MISHLFSIYDQGVQQFAAPVMATSETAVRRSLDDLFTAESTRPLLERSNYVRYAADYILYYVGTFDTDSGVVSPVTPAFRVCSLEDFIH